MNKRGEELAAIIGDPDYERLKDTLISASGLAYYRERDDYFAELIGRRLAKLGLSGCDSYSRLLSENPEGAGELDTMIGEMTIGETYFFRDRQQFDALRDVAIPRILEANQATKRLRVWSAGCSNGSEPYSLAILLAQEFGRRLIDWDVKIYATDINRQCLAEAELGRFQEWALRGASPAIRSECFTTQGRTWIIHPEYRKWIEFGYLNLAAGEFPLDLGSLARLDLILCRNVMIYFSPDVVRRLVGKFYRALGEGGWFVAGAAEHNMENYTSFETVNLEGATIYRKGGKQPVEKTAPAFGGLEAFLTAEWPVCAPEPLPLRIETLEVPRNAPEPPVHDCHAPAIEELRQLADRGDRDNALRRCGELLEQDPMNPVVHFYHSLVLESMDRPADAERSLRQAIYLDPHFLLAHYHLGLALVKGKQPQLAVRSFKNVGRLSSGKRDGQVLENTDGLTVAGLKAMAKIHLQNLGDS